LEGLGYAVGSVDFPAAGVASPHRRQRFFWVGYAGSKRLEGAGGDTEGQCQIAVEAANPWRNHGILRCDEQAQEKASVLRRVEPGTFPLVDGISYRVDSGSPLAGKSRVGMLRAFGNAIVPQVAARFIKVFMEVA